MSTEHLDAYRAIFCQLLFEREAAGGDLSEEQESLFVERLDALWWQLSATEQETIEAEIASPLTLAVGEEINFVDREVAKGSRESPRRAA